MPNLKQKDPIDFLIVTRVLEKTYKFQWIIRKFSVLSKNKALYSTCIYASTTSCYLKLIKYENGFGLFQDRKLQTKETKKANHLGKGSGYFGSQSDLSEDLNETSEFFGVNLDYQVSVTDCKGNELIKWSARFSDDSESESCKIGEYINNSLEHFPDDSLTLDCTLKVILVPITEEIPIASKPSLESNSWKNLSKDFKALYQSSLDTDVTLVNGTNEIQAHRLILTARSRVFKSLFQEKNSVSITDVEFSTLKRLVEFLYCGSIVDGENKDLNLEELYELYYTADQLEVMDLREMVGNTLMERIHVDNASDILFEADRHDDKDLKLRIMNFIRINFEVVSNTDAWESCVIHHPELAIEVVNFCFKTPENSIN